MRRILAPVIMTIGAVALACSGPTEPPPLDFQYPLAYWNKWVYDLTISKDFDGERSNEVAARMTVGIQVVDTINYLPQIPEYVLIEYEGFDWDETFHEYDRYVNLKDGLYLLGSGWGPKFELQPKLVTDGGIHVGDRTFSSLAEIPRWSTGGLSGLARLAQTEDEAPRLSLRYPLTTHSTWVYDHAAFDSTTVISKRVMGIESISTSAGAFACVRVDWIYEGTFSQISVSDYYARVGLVYRRISVEGIEETDFSNPFGTGEIYTGIWEYALTYYNLRHQ